LKVRRGSYSHAETYYSRYRPSPYRHTVRPAAHRHSTLDFCFSFDMADFAGWEKLDLAVERN